MRKLTLSFFTMAALSIGATFIHGQSCRGSHLTYIVRDGKGKMLDPAALAFTYAGGASRASQRWANAKDPVRNIVDLPAELSGGKTPIMGLTTSEFCNFREPLNLSVTMGGKVMELTFNVPQMGSQQSADFLVDSLAFKPGKYEISLVRTQGVGGYFAPAGWKRLP